MPRQSSFDLRRDILLENVAIQFLQDRNLYVAHRAAGIVPVSDSSGYYRKYSLGDLVRNEAGPRAPGTEAKVGSIGSSDEQYVTAQEAFKDYVTDEDYGDDRGPVGVRDLRTQSVMQAHITRLERKWGTACFTTGIWGTNLTGVASATPTAGTQFRQFDHTGCDPVHEILTIKQLMGAATGYEPNVLVITADVFRVLMTNASLMARVTGAGSSAAPAQLNERILAGLFGLDEVLVSKAVLNSAAEGQTDSIGYMFTNRILLLHRSANASKEIPSACYNFVWDKPNNTTTPAQVQVASYYREAMGREDIEARMHYDIKVTASNLGIYGGSALGNP